MLNYRAVRNRVAVNFESLNLPIAKSDALEILKGMDFRIIDVDMVKLAREYIEKSTYRLGARLFEAPKIFDCSSFPKWVYGQHGIWLPRRSIQQFQMGEPVLLNKVRDGDLVFFAGYRKNHFYDKPEEGIGHVALATSEKTLIQITFLKGHLHEESLDAFLEKRAFRGARRYISLDRKVITLEAPKNREVETADDIRWIILQSL